MRMDLQVLQNDPLAFIHLCWPDDVIYDKQAEILHSVAANKATWVHAAAEVGKDWAAARTILWFYCTRFPAKVVATSSTEKQLKNVLWGEIDRAVRTSVVPLGLSMKYLEIELEDGEGGTFRDHWVRLMVALHVESFQGVHLPTTGIPRVLFVMDECSSLRDEFYRAAESQAHRILSIGNPLRAQGLYARECKAGDEVNLFGNGLSRKVIHIDGDDSPNVKAGKRYVAAKARGRPPVLIPGILSYEDYMHREAKWDAYNRAVRLHGRFYEGDDRQMFPAAWLDAAERAWQRVKGMDRGPCYLGVDVAAGGRDQSVWIVVDHLGIVECMVKDTPDTTVLPEITLSLMGKHGIRPMHVCVDSGGGGKQAIVDPLARIGKHIRGIAFGGGATRPKVYRNTRVEMYAALSEAFDPATWRTAKDVDKSGRVVDTGEYTQCMSFDWSGDSASEFSELRNELQSMPVMYDQEGRQWLLPKEKQSNHSSVVTLRELIGHSPDRADALALANWAMVYARRQRAPRVDRPLVYDPEEFRKDKPDEGEPKDRRSALERRIFGPV